MMKKKLFVLLTVVCILALATACGSQTSGTDTDSNAGTQSGAQQEESTLTGKLDEHLKEIGDTAQEMFGRLVAQMKEAEGVTERLKAENQMEWVGRMNSIRSRAEEIILSELVYC